MLAVVGACGRVGFQPIGSAPDASGDASTDAAPDGPDASTVCAGGDGVCRESCLASDPDCATTCGDGRCVGNAGELCANCAADCATTSPVSGNGACDPGEDSDICFADCGPTPWPWTSDEAALLAAVNSARTAGVMCPGTGAPTTAPPALTELVTLQPNVRERAWEIAFQGFIAPDGHACNGRTLAQLLGGDGARAELGVQNAVTASAAVQAWATDGNLCPLLVSTSYTQFEAGVGHATSDGWVVQMK